MHVHAYAGLWHMHNMMRARTESAEEPSSMYGLHMYDYRGFLQPAHNRMQIPSDAVVNRPACPYACSKIEGSETYDRELSRARLEHVPPTPCHAMRAPPARVQALGRKGRGRATSCSHARGRPTEAARGDRHAQRWVCKCVGIGGPCNLHITCRLDQCKALSCP